MTRLYILFLFAFTACAEHSKQPPKTVQSFALLNGDWQMTEGDGIITESWKPVNDSLMEGRSDFIKGDTVIPFETIKLYRKVDSFYYEAKAAGQNNEQPVAFTITSFSDSGFIAENRQHDFPKRILYKFVNKDSIYARVDDGLENPQRKAEFYYSRSKN